jgi:serine/threonine-protein kinase
MPVDPDTIRRARQRIGTTLRNKYHLDRVLGIGGMGVVYAATHRNKKQFAIKMLHAELSIREEIRSRFLREGYAANSVKHVGVVAVLDDDVTEDGTAFLVMELLEGAPLERLWEKHARQMPVASVLTIADQLLDVLASAHATGIVHRDIKPGNLFITNGGQLKILDFGIARVRDTASSAVGATSAGAFLGTPAYMAPEQAFGNSSEVEPRTDLWAVGATLFTLLCGELVHTGENAQQVTVRAATVPARSLAAVKPDVPASVVYVIDRALAFRKEERWPTAAAMRHAIQEAHLSEFGRGVSRDALLPVVSVEDPVLGLDAATPQPSNVARTTHTDSLPHDTEPAHVEVVHAVMHTTQLSPSATTSQAVSSARQESGQQRTQRRATVVGVLLIVAAALSVGITKVTQLRSRTAASIGTVRDSPAQTSALSPIASKPVDALLSSNISPPQPAPPTESTHGPTSRPVFLTRETDSRPASSRSAHSTSTPPKLVTSARSSSSASSDDLYRP